MTKEQKEIWLAALRSGIYPQTKGALRDQEGYCCLGVASEVCGLGVSPNESYLRSAFGNAIFLPMNLQGDLSELNDTEGLTFSEIADYIELNVQPTE